MLCSVKTCRERLRSLRCGPLRAPLRTPSEATTVCFEPQDVPDRVEHPRKISGKQERPIHCREPFFHHFFAKTCVSPDEEKIISELRLSTLNELLHKLATELLHFAQDVVTEELKMIAQAAVKNDGYIFAVIGKSHTK